MLRNLAILLSGAVALLGAGTPQEDLLAALPKAKVSLEEGVRQLSKGDEVAISAKFEMEEGHLSLSVYTVEKGLAADPEHNVLKEFAGSPEGTEYKPKAEVFEDKEHISRASMQLTLMALSKVSLADLVAKAKKDQAGTVYSVKPMLKGRKAVAEVLVANQGKSVQLWYDLLTGLAVKE